MWATYDWILPVFKKEKALHLTHKGQLGFLLSAWLKDRLVFSSVLVKTNRLGKRYFLMYEQAAVGQQLTLVWSQNESVNFKIDVC